jgi:hypothetical protein
MYSQLSPTATNSLKVLSTAPLPTCARPPFPPSHAAHRGIKPRPLPLPRSAERLRQREGPAALALGHGQDSSIELRNRVIRRGVEGLRQQRRQRRPREAHAGADEEGDEGRVSQVELDEEQGGGCRCAHAAKVVGGQHALVPHHCRVAVAGRGERWAVWVWAEE